ncbi:MAG TPA: siphovirus Gp157 family protein [Noviherbaspirillum sp.]|jgi:transposase-like protein|uniref:siphovirus Gp157 family protein n=1 Tax=Noviherbaspirillum sp. TaxID=1926288 RepID=UPI002DDD5D83|nr:siphovirus Gp157 family protein [Noviherbaspirillum sp.]HEV2610860.1 siphovirus Gp157 family protein [Noviherbaspirillum sp.]
MNPVFEAFELAAQYRRLAEMLAERHDDEQLIADTLESMSGPFDERLENLAKMVRNMETAANGVEKTIESLEARHAALRRGAERGRKLILELMQTARRDRVTTALFSLTVKKNPPVVVVDRETDLPSVYLTQHEAPPPMPNKKAIAAALKAGIEVPGARTEQGVRLDIQ